MWILVVDCHQGGEPAALNQWHADRRANANTLKRCRLRRRDFLQIVVDHEGAPGAKLLHCQLTEVRQAVVTDDRRRSRRMPVTSNSKTVLVLVHVSIRAIGKAEMLCGKASCDRHNFVSVSRS